MKNRIEDHLGSVIVKGLLLQAGDTVKARLGGRVIQGEIAAIYETTAGVQVRIVNGDFIFNVDASQIIR